MTLYSYKIYMEIRSSFSKFVLETWSSKSLDKLSISRWHGYLWSHSTYFSREHVSPLRNSKFLSHYCQHIYIYIQFNGNFGAIPSWILTHLFSHMICTYAILMCSLHPKLISSDETHTMRKVGRLLNWEFQVSPLCCAYPPNDTKYLDQPKHSKVCESLFK